MHRALPPAVVSAATMLVVAVWPAAADPVPVPPLTVAQLCAAVSVEAVDALLVDVTAEVLVGDLAPLAPLTATDADAVVLATGVTVAQVHAALGCDEPAPSTSAAPPSSSVPPSSATATPAPTTAPTLPPNADLTGLTCAEFAAQADAQEAFDGGQADPAKVDPDGDGVACESGGQVQVIPQGGVDTGGWPAE